MQYQSIKMAFDFVFTYVLLIKLVCESEGWGFESLSGRDIFCLKNFDTFTRTSVRVSKMNAVAHARLTVQLLTLLQKYLLINT